MEDFEYYFEFIYLGRVSLYSPNCPETHYVEQYLKLGFQLLWRDTMTMATFIKENI